MRQIILDTETTGLDPRSGHKIVEIGCIEIVNKLKTGNFLHFYINPERDVPEESFKIHGISTSFLKDKPKFREIAHEFVAFIGDSDLVIHNAAFDLKFLNYELELISLQPILSNKIIDTIALARKKFPGSPANLNALCKRFNISLKERNQNGHGALLDSELLYGVYVCLEEGMQSELVVEKNSGSIAKKISRSYTPPREFNYPKDSQEHNSFVKTIKNNLWSTKF